jgi:ATP-dependent DNA helicase RecG
MPENVTKILKVGESETIEFKNSLAEHVQILETVSAFANTRGGAIYVGVDPKGKITGVQLGKRTLEGLANDIKLKTDPRIFPSIDTIAQNGKRIIRVVVEEHPTKPVWVGDKVFVRVGRTNQRAPSERIRQLMRETQPFQWDQRIIGKAKLSEIDPARVKSFLRKVEDERNTVFEGSRSAAGVLSKLHLLKDGKLTPAALLLFGKEPQERFLQAQVRCAKFNGPEPVDFADIKVLSGTIIEQVPEILSLIRKHINVAAKITGKPEREEVWEYPREALREAVVNAICHRDYEDTGNVQVRIFDDRLEVWNPGTLPPGVTLESLKADHRSQPRNILIAQCFYLIKYVEQWGTGTNRIIKLCREARLPAPEFAQKAGSFVVTFRRAKKFVRKAETLPSVRLNETQKKILRYLEKRGEARTNELVEAIRVSRTAIQNNLKKLSELIEWTGSSATDPEGKYKLRR